MPKIIIHRKKEIAYRFMKFYLILNNKRIKSLDPGESFAIDVTEGSYSLRIKGGLFISSNTLHFHIRQDETKGFQVESFKGGFVKKHLRLYEIESFAPFNV